MKNRTAVVIYAAAIAASIAIVWAVGARSNRVHEQRAADWAAWEADMRRAGCKVTGFTSERSATYSIWSCPDGTAHLGRSR